MVSVFLTEAGGSVDLRLAGFGFAVLLASVHVLAGRAPFRTGEARRRWVSAASGASVAYAFVLLFPEVVEVVAEAGVGFTVEKYVSVFALVGFVFFYGVEVYVAQARREDPEESDLVFYGHLLTFGAYNLLIGYLLVYQERPGLANLTAYAGAMAFHFFVNDASLRSHHGSLYDRVGRWLLAGTVLLGAGIGSAAQVDDLVVGTLFAFLAGSIVFNVVKDELPNVRESRFWTFVVGATAYATVLLLL